MPAMFPSARRSARFWRRSARGSGRLRGVVHAASAIGDGLAADIDAEAATAILKPKLAGAIALDG